MGDFDDLESADQSFVAIRPPLDLAARNRVEWLRPIGLTYSIP